LDLAAPASAAPAAKASPAKPTGARELDLGPAPATTPKVYKGQKPLSDVPARARPKDTFGPASAEKGGTEARTDLNFHTYNPAEISNARLRVDWDPKAGRPRGVTYEVDASVANQTSQTDRAFSKSPLDRGAQSSDAAYTNSGYDRGHLAQREAFKGDADAEKAADHFTNVVPMSPELNQGAAWRDAERRTFDLAREHGRVKVSVTPVYDAHPLQLPDGTPIPKEVVREVSLPDGTSLEKNTFANSPPAAPSVPPATQVRVGGTSAQPDVHVRVSADTPGAELDIEAGVPVEDEPARLRRSHVQR
jgi:DNA/RNA endonuclease G (NUC1)